MQRDTSGSLLAVLSIALVGLLAGCTSLEQELDKGLYAQIVTERGEIVAELNYQKTPLTVRNFVGLAEGSIAHTRDESDAFYDGLTFHRVVEDFVIQAGDPQGDGTGGPGYQIPDEFDQTLRHDVPGVLSMANRGPDTGGSQFFITLKPAPWLDDKHSVFGRVVRGMDVVRSIEEGDRIEHVNIVRVGAEAKAFETDQAAFDEALAEARAAKDRKRVQAIERQQEQIRSSFPNAKKTDSGIYYVIETEGAGPQPQAGDTVAVHYTGSLLNGMPFESTENRDQPVQFTVGSGRIIPGWTRCLWTCEKAAPASRLFPRISGSGHPALGRSFPRTPTSYSMYS